MSIQIYILGKLMQKNTYPYQLKKDLSITEPSNPIPSNPHPLTGAL